MHALWCFHWGSNEETVRGAERLGLLAPVVFWWSYEQKPASAVLEKSLSRCHPFCNELLFLQVSLKLVFS